ncbi:diguanylate cyclase [Bifidobacterium tibiigranuli]|jgi:dihydroorotate dehydrogenase|uniref:diguanylate cyclase n=1 Tax=Bifidobacterium tibiigranuli TaxID=2172043 RepID=UPI0023552C46|nr:diguanylate cyclase [Bifidobacterium tibiigranuli]MCI1210946.1 diguanylate cyclase [Bifidobacterium tibiigranuli]MCI1220487.1 diguanylate cyclase [Bifidobacterium tibiigranuli]
MAEYAEPFYDVNLSYAENYERGPFGAFAGALAEQSSQPTGLSTSKSDANFLGFPVNLPFGIPAGPLLNSRFTTAAFRMGFDLAVYKTVRTRAWDCNPFPNVLSVHPRTNALTPGDAELDEGVLADSHFERPLSISNSFGVPSRDPDEWQPDMRAAIAAAGSGQLLIPSFQGSRNEGMATSEYIADHVTAAKLVRETGAQLMEMNTSCPNEGRNRLLCDDPRLVGEITQAVKNEIGDMPLIIKLAYLPSNEALERMVHETAARGSVQAFATINTVSAKLVDRKGNQALPGEGRERSGVCGSAIRSAGLDMVRRLAGVRERLGLDFAIIGIGGVMGPADYQAYRSAGADAVMSATGAMWDCELAHRIKGELVQQ